MGNNLKNNPNIGNTPLALEECNCSQQKSATELFFKWLSDFTLPMVKDPIGARIIGLIFAATFGIAISCIAIVLASEKIIIIIDKIK